MGIATASIQGKLHWDLELKFVVASFSAAARYT